MGKGREMCVYILPTMIMCVEFRFVSLDNGYPIVSH